MYAIASAMSAASALNSLEVPADPLPDLGPVMARQLRIDRAGFDKRDADVPPGHLLVQRLAERPDAVLGRVVDPAAAASHPPRHRADVDHVRDPAGAVLGRAQEVRKRGV